MICLIGWSMESGEHMPDKKKFMNELVRVTAPGGRIIIVTWCHRELLASETSLKPNEIKLLNKINKAYYLPTSKYIELAKESNLIDIRSDDWSEYVKPFWPAVIKSALNPKNLWGLLKSGLTTIRGMFCILYVCHSFCVLQSFMSLISIIILFVIIYL